jgi:alpha-glucosidase
MGYTHSDIGGYTTIGWIKRRKELFMRWAELAAFSPIMRTHEGIRPEANWQFDSDEETLQHLARMTRVYTALKDYILHCGAEYQQRGLPLLRHPYLHYENDETLHHLQYQYLFGRDLLVAPVYLPRRCAWWVYLPEDEWLHLWSGQAYAGGRWHPIAAPLGEPPVFYRRASAFGELFARIGREEARAAR